MIFERTLAYSLCTPCSIYSREVVFSCIQYDPKNPEVQAMRPVAVRKGGGENLVTSSNEIDGAVAAICSWPLKSQGPNTTGLQLKHCVSF